MSVTIPESMKCIDEYAFGFITNEKLVEVINYSDVPLDNEYYICNFAKYTKDIHQGESKLDAVGDYIFYSHDGVNYLMGYTGAEKNITLPESYGGEPYEIYNYAFAYNNIIESVVIPYGVTAIGEKAFEGCKSLKNVEESIDDYTFCVSDSSVSSNKQKEGVEQDGFLFREVEGKIYLVGYIGSETRLTLPESFGGKKYDIYNEAFWDMRDITEVIIPEGVTQIWGSAFKGCSSLVKVTLPESVTYMSVGVFAGCSSLEEITIPSGITEINNHTFDGCTELSRVRLHDNITLINQDAFYNCSSLRHIVLPWDLTDIRDRVFEGCGELSGILIPKFVNHIGARTFNGCTNMTNIAVLEKNEYFESVDGVLYLDSKLKQYPLGKRDESFTVPEEIEIIGDRAFAYSPYLKNVIISNSVTTVKDYAFYKCSALESVTLGNSVNTIGEGVFNGCKSLESIELPDSLNTIGARAFSNCESLSSITVGEGNPWYKSIDGNLYSKNGKTLIQYATGKTDKSFTVPDSVTALRDKAFADCTFLETVVIGKNVTTIGYYTFSLCYNMKQVIFANTEGWWTDDHPDHYWGIEIPKEVLSDPYEAARALLFHDYGDDWYYFG